jgi:hypothetical protein
MSFSFEDLYSDLLGFRGTYFLWHVLATTCLKLITYGRMAEFFFQGGEVGQKN